MAFFLTLLFIHIPIILFILALLFIIGLLIMKEDDNMERILRGMFFLLGAMIYTIAAIFKITIPELIINIFINFDFITSFITSALSAYLGFIAQSIMVKLFNRDENLAIKMAILVSPFVIFSYIHLYYITISPPGDAEVKLLLPNMLFLIGVVFSFGIQYSPQKNKL